MAAQYSFITRTQIGDTVRSQLIWVYVMSNADNLTISGAVVASAPIKGGIHAHEWQSHSLLYFDVATEDFVGQGLNTNSATMISWDNGAWTNYEATAGNNASDAGGIGR
ncbi:MAG: hypothetical protein ACPHYA_08170 [Pseudomonadales bacterium]